MPGRVKRDHLATVAVERVLRERSERNRLRDVKNKLDEDCFMTIYRLDRDMQAIKVELDMKVKRKSLPLRMVDIPAKRPPLYGEGFDPRRHMNQSHPGDRTTRSRSELMKNAKILDRMHSVSIQSAWPVTRILKWYRISNEDDLMY
jgi:hypothetical protein